MLKEKYQEKQGGDFIADYKNNVECFTWYKREKKCDMEFPYGLLTILPHVQHGTRTQNIVQIRYIFMFIW